MWDKGDPTGSTSKARVPKSGWAIESTSDDSAPAGDHITEILGRSAGLTRKIHELLATGVVDSAQFWVHLNSPISGISLTADELRAIAEIGSLEVDIYS